MQERIPYETLTKEELIRIILDQQAQITALCKEVEELRDPVVKTSENSSIPTSKEFIPRTRSQREKSGKKPGGQPGHNGHHRERNPHPEKTVRVQASHCENGGTSLEEVEGTIGRIAQQVDIPPVRPVTTQYQQIIKVCACGHCNQVPLPIEADVTIGPQMGALITYLNVEHSLPYARLTQITQDLLGFALSQGTVENKLRLMHRLAKGVVERIKKQVMRAGWTGSDETSTRIGGKTFWQWVWQCPQASFYAVDKRRGYGAVQEHFTENYQGILIHDCWSAQNNTPASAHQLCHAHLVRNLQYAIDKERSLFAYHLQRLLLKSQRARDAIWQAGITQQRREAVIQFYKNELEKLLAMQAPKPEERRLQKRFVKHRDWIFTFMSYPDVPADNNSSERAIKAAKLKDNVSGGFRAVLGASRFADLLSLTQTLRKQELPILPALTALFQGQDLPLFSPSG